MSKKHKLTLYKTQNGESNLVTISSSLIFTRSYLPVQNLGDRHPNTIELASCLVHVLCDFKLHGIKKLTSVSLKYTMEVHLADAYILLYIYFLLLQCYQFSNKYFQNYQISSYSSQNLRGGITP